MHGSAITYAIVPSPSPLGRSGRPTYAPEGTTSHARGLEARVKEARRLVLEVKEAAPPTEVEALAAPLRYTLVTPRLRCVRKFAELNQGG
jgi:hypothetical protein